MNKKLQEMLDRINEQKTEVQNLVAEDKIEEAKTAKKELQKMQDKYNLVKDLEDKEKEEVVAKVTTGEAKTVGKNDAIKEFANAARSGFRMSNAMKEGNNPDGGYTVPEDISTRIEEYRGATASLVDLVDVEPVSTNKGARTFKKRSQQTGFVKVGEGNAIPGKKTPQFERLEYEIDKYAGYFPVTNELLADSDANIVSVLTRWIGDESRITRNKLIIEIINSKTAVEIEGLIGIKKVLNVTLGQAFKPTSRIITNDDGLQYLDTLVDDKGNFLLQPDPVTPMQMVLAAGATRIPITVIPNGDMPTDDEKIPFIIGDLKEGIKFFDRKQLSIMASNEASTGNFNAFEQDMTLFRAIEREDCIIRDGEAFVNGYIVGE